MKKDGDAMQGHEYDRSEPARRHPDVRRDDQNLAEHAARRALAAGHVHNVEHSAVMHLQRLAGNAGVGSLVENEEPRRSPVLDVVGKGGGRPLPTDVRAEMETGLGADFGGVRVHDDTAAAASAQAVDAKAYTVGNEVVFNRGAYQPETTDGRHTLAHELTHVVQQRSGPVSGTSTGDGVSLSDPDDRFEREAEATATSFGKGTPAMAAPAGSVQRQEEEPEAQAMPLQRQEEEEVPEAQAMPLQRQEEEEEEPEAQAMPLQRQEEEEEMPSA